jgi:hypothetical protein
MEAHEVNMRPLQIKTTDEDRENIALHMALYHRRTMADAVRNALQMSIDNATPEALEQARRAVKRARKEQA